MGIWDAKIWDKETQTWVDNPDYAGPVERETVVGNYRCVISYSSTRRKWRVECFLINKNGSETRVHNFYAQTPEDAIADYESQVAYYSGNQPIDTEVIIQDENFELTTYEFLQMKFSLRIIEITKGTESAPIVTYRVEEYFPFDSINPNRIGKSQTVDTQVEAEELWSEWYDERVDEYDTSTQDDFENRYETVTVDEVELFWKESDLSMRDMVRDDANYDSEVLAFRAGRSFWPDERQGAFYGDGHFGDALIWSNGGNTLELVDFDTPRITSEGVQENLSGAIAFTVRYGWRISFNLKTNSMTFTLREEDEVENISDEITVDADEFDFVMYGGDRIEIDIDNEREGVYPFLITVAGKEWSSQIEIDDEVFLTMKKAEQVWYSRIEGTRQVYINPPNEGQVKEESITETEGRVSLPSDSVSLDTMITQALENEPAMAEALTMTRVQTQTEVVPEGGFIDPDKVLPDTPTLSGVGDIWDSVKWWVIGGIAVIVIVGGIYVFINARAIGGD